MWEPPLSPKQQGFYRDDRTILGAVGARGSGKTRVIEHRYLKLAWRTNPFRLAIIVNTNKTGYLGIWPELTTEVYDVWIRAGIGNSKARFGWAQAPKFDSNLKLYSAKLYNRHGGVSEIVLFPVLRAEDALAKLNSTIWSHVWLSECQNVKGFGREEAHLFDAALSQLRLHPDMTQMGLVCDANPPDAGLAHWFYGPFEEDRTLAEEEIPDHWDTKRREDFIAYQKQIGLYRFALDDNPFLSRGRSGLFRATYARSDSRYNRFVLGQDQDEGKSPILLNAYFDKNRHVFGRAEGSDESKWEVMCPSDSDNAERMDGRIMIIDGWDPGSSNYAWAAIQPWINNKGVECYDVIDEFVSIRGGLDLERDVVPSILAQRDRLESLAGFKLGWSSWGDRSIERAWDEARKSASALSLTVPKDEKLCDMLAIFKASKGRVRLQACGEVQNRGWQRRRVNFFARLLRDGRIRISAHCKWAIAFCQKLRENTSPKARTYLVEDQEEKHMFDATTYPLAMRNLEELLRGDEPEIRPKITK